MRLNTLTICVDPWWDKPVFILRHRLDYNPIHKANPAAIKSFNSKKKKRWISKVFGNLLCIFMRINSLLLLYCCSFGAIKSNVCWPQTNFSCINHCLSFGCTLEDSSKLINSKVTCTSILQASIRYVTRHKYSSHWMVRRFFTMSVCDAPQLKQIENNFELVVWWVSSIELHFKHDVRFFVVISFSLLLWFFFRSYFGLVSTIIKWIQCLFNSFTSTISPDAYFPSVTPMLYFSHQNSCLNFSWYTHPARFHAPRELLLGSKYCECIKSISKLITPWLSAVGSLF